MQKNYIVKPVVTEKAVANGNLNKYTFIVRSDANKIALSQQLASLYGVKPTKVNIQNIPGKHRNIGRRIMTKRKPCKRAIVTFPKDSNIDVFKPKQPKK